MNKEENTPKMRLELVLRYILYFFVYLILVFTAFYILKLYIDNRIVIILIANIIAGSISLLLDKSIKRLVESKRT